MFVISCAKTIMQGVLDGRMVSADRPGFFDRLALVAKAKPAAVEVRLEWEQFLDLTHTWIVRDLPSITISRPFPSTRHTTSSSFFPALVRPEKKPLHLDALLTRSPESQREASILEDVDPVH